MCPQSSGHSDLSHPVSKNITWRESDVAVDARRELLGHHACTVWLTGLSGAGKTTIARGLENRLMDMGVLALVLDGDNVRHGLNRDLGFSPTDRSENIRRVAEMSKMLNDGGLIVISAFISPYASDRQHARKIVEDGHRFFEVFVDAPLSECERRDPRSLYKKARMGHIAQFTGVSSPYESPTDSDCVLPTTTLSVEACIKSLVELLVKSRILIIEE